MGLRPKERRWGQGTRFQARRQSPSPAQFVAGVLSISFLKTPRRYSNAQVPRPSVLYPNHPSSSVERCHRETRKATRKRLVKGNHPKNQMKNTMYIYSGPPSAMETCRLTPPLSMGYYLPSLSLCWPLTVLTQPISLHSESTDFDPSVWGSGPPVRSTLASCSEQTYLVSPVSDNVCANPRSAVSTPAGRGTRFWRCTRGSNSTGRILLPSGGAQCWSPGAKGEPPTTKV
jgi:hypothetical protein